MYTHSAMYSSGVQLPKSASGMNFLFIGVSKVTLEDDDVIMMLSWLEMRACGDSLQTGLPFSIHSL